MNDSSTIPERPSNEPSGPPPESFAQDGRLLDGAVVAVAVCTLVVSVAAVLVSGPARAGGALVGGMLATANLWIIVRLSRRWRASPGHAWGVIGAGKLVALLTVTFVVLRSGVVDGLGFAFGYAALPVGIVAAQMAAALRSPPPPSATAGVATARTLPRI